MRLLIVNADDFNSDPGRSRGILAARRDGIVTSTTALMNLPWDAGVAEELKSVFGNAIGVHLNLTEGRPLVSGTRTLCAASGDFFPKPLAWRRALLGRYDLQEVAQEFAAQIEYALALGITPSHLDGNNHLHIFPGIAQVTARMARRFKIQRVRWPREKRGYGFSRYQGKRCFIGLLALLAGPVFRRHGLRSADHFAGIGRPDLQDPASLMRFMETLRPGVTELMCHPGFPVNDPGKPFSNPSRECELVALTRPWLHEVLRELDIRLVSYADL